MKGERVMGGVPKQVMEADAEASALLEQQAEAEKRGAKFVFDTKGEHPQVDDPNAAPHEPQQPAPEQPADPEQPEPQPSDEGGDGGVLPKGGQEGEHDQFADEKAAQNQRLLYARLEQTSAENKELKKRNAELEGKLASLAEDVAQLKSSQPQPGAQPSPTPASPKNREALRDFLRQKMGEGYTDKDLDAFMDCVDALVTVRTDTLTRRMDADAANRAKAKLDGFMRHMREAYPAFPEMDAKNDPRWVAFLNSQINPDVPGITYRQLVQNALRTENYSEFERYVKVFGKNYGIDFSLNPKGGELQIEGQVVPRSLPPQKRAERPVKPKLVPRSEIDMFRKSFIRKTAMRDFNMTAEQVQAQLRFYEDVEAAGNVDENK